MENQKKTKVRQQQEDTTSNDSSGTALTVEQIYQKKSQLEHILLRPDTYVGSIEPVQQSMWVYDDEESKMIQKKVTICPGLYKIFDEIIVNACDNKQRDNSMDTLKVTINVEDGEISVWNNGHGIPVVIHKEHNVYVPELIFGHLLTGSNFDDKKKKTTGGRNGYGAKLANIFSREFIVETGCQEQGKKYRQVFSENMSVKGVPKITSWSKKDFTCITFKPDFERFQMTGLDEDIVALFKKRVYDIAGVTDKSLNVYLNDKKITVKTFPQYVSLYGSEEIIFDKPDERWQVGLGISDEGFQQVSFVNGICTTKGGQHVNYIADQIATKLIAVVKKKNKGEAIKPAYVKNHMFLYVSALIDNPAFDSQTKETLTTRPPSFGSTFTLSDKFLKGVEKSGLVDRILSFAKFKQTAELKKTSGGKRTRLTGISKLDDANFAGSAKGQDCTLILTEGDSAKALAMSGLSVVGRDYYGVFPLRGKLLNVREAAHSAILKNEEIQNIVKILGLKYGTTYESTKSLRYGHLMIMADQDHDGSHIKGLVINFIHHFWPSLMGLDSFVQQFITPIVKATKGNRCKVFYTVPEYETWRNEMYNIKGWHIKYYKGLGTSKSDEVRTYFSDLNTHQIGFTYGGDIDGDAIDMAFSKKRVEDRKEWLRSFVPGTHMDFAVQDMSYSEFVNKELILFSMADNIRSIPSVVDGFKPSQRKVLFSCFKRKLKNEIKVAQLSGYIAEHSAYHHGEVNLHGTIIGMAQTFVGSNNINLLSPNGQFGTRLQGGKDASSARYIYTNLEPITRIVFNPLDDAILNYIEDEGQSVEPTWYMPIIPMALVNGSDGIGTGWSSSIPNYNPLDIIENLKRRLNAEPMIPMSPFYRGFTGNIIQKGNSDNFLVQGRYEIVDDSTIIISELPVKTWTQNYKQILENMIESGIIKDFRENHTDTTVLFTVTLTPESLKSIEQLPGGIIKKFKLETSLAISNMQLFNSNGQIKHYNSPMDIIEEFYHLRLNYYNLRKKTLLKKLEREIMILSNKMRFILAVIDGSLVVNNRKKKIILEELCKNKYDPIPKTIHVTSIEEIQEEEEEEEEMTEVSAKDYDYLLSMALWSLTAERVELLRQELENRQNERDKIFSTTLEEMWLRDLDVLVVEIEKTEVKRIADENETKKQAGKAKGARVRASNKKTTGKKRTYPSDDDSGSDFDLPKRKIKKEIKKKEPKKTAQKETIINTWKKPIETKPIETKSNKTTKKTTEKSQKLFKLFEKSKSIVESSEDEEILSLAERLKRRAMAEKKESDDDDVFDGGIQIKEKKDEKKTIKKKINEKKSINKKILKKENNIKKYNDESSDEEIIILNKRPERIKKPIEYIIDSSENEEEENDESGELLKSVYIFYISHSTNMATPVLSIDTQHDDMIHDAQLDYYGKRLATCSSDRTIKVYDVTHDVQQSNEQILTGHEGPVWQVNWAHPKFGTLLASCSYDGKVIIYKEAQLGKWSQVHVHTFHQSSVNSIAWAPYEYGLTLACASADGKVSILNHTAAEGWTTTFFQDSTLGCNAVSWAPYHSYGKQGKRLVTASCDNSIKIWFLADGSNDWIKEDLNQTNPHHGDWVRDVAWAPSTGAPVNTIASASEDRTVSIWTQVNDERWTKELLHTFDAPVWRVSWSITGNVLAVSSGDHKVTLWKESLEKKWIQISSVDEVGTLNQAKEG